MGSIRKIAKRAWRVCRCAESTKFVHARRAKGSIAAAAAAAAGSYATLPVAMGRGR
jgi:hypothetical protein